MAAGYTGLARGLIDCLFPADGEIAGVKLCTQWSVVPEAWKEFEYRVHATLSPFQCRHFPLFFALNLDVQQNIFSG